MKANGSNISSYFCFYPILPFRVNSMSVFTRGAVGKLIMHILKSKVPDSFTILQKFEFENGVGNVPGESNKMFHHHLDGNWESDLSGGFWYQFSCDFIKDSDKIIQHLAVNIDIGYGENSGYLLTIQFLVYGGIFFMLYCAILHAKKSQQGIWSKVETIGLIFLTMSHILSLFTVRMGKIFISCAKDPNYDLLFVAAVGSIFLSLGNAMALFYQSVKKPTIPGADYHLKYHIP
ncbi:hypothetical protein T01_1631 [Trichinella spiralis]|uniref:Uncharacterized protein n=1 Tax=Trichinella spiralis TaxID=6334 RepID=A0A0V1B5P0_TRISP|nr:hypothetical protein T01_1631 [Trichinella spiralis]